MRVSIIAFPVAVLFQATAVETLVVFAGQSNAKLIPVDHAYRYAVEIGLPGPAVISSAFVGRPISYWLEGRGVSNLGRQLRRLQQSGSLAGVRQVCVCWMQGEADAKTSGSDDYERDLRLLLQHFTVMLADVAPAADCHFVIGELGDYGLHHLSLYRGWRNVQAAQRVVGCDPALPTSLISTADLGAGLHYRWGAHRLLGQRFLDRVAEILLPANG